MTRTHAYLRSRNTNDVSNEYEEQLSDLIADFVRSENIQFKRISNSTNLLRASQLRMLEWSSSNRQNL